LRIAREPDPDADLRFGFVKEPHSFDGHVAHHDGNPITDRSDGLEQLATLVVAALDERECVRDDQSHRPDHGVVCPFDGGRCCVLVGDGDLGAAIAHEPGRIGGKRFELRRGFADAV
jgi:hypothetical protein